MHRWKLSALAAAALVTVSLTAADAWALTLGQLSVQSGPGEPLRAEVELPRITAAEADTLQASIASPAVFRAQGIEYTPVASQFNVQLLRRPDGSAVLRLSSAQPVTQPFVDLVIDASWSAGQVVRSYTLLLDQSAGRQSGSATNPPQIGAPAPAPMAQPAVTAAPVQRAPAAAAPLTEITVRAGSTASELAQAHRPAGVSLDQMLVAMLRANPHAFISGNVNRMRAGAVLEMPDQTAAQATSIREARQLVAAQSQDFNRYRRQLAAAAPAAAVTAAQRSASGNIEAQVEDRKPATAAPDKLTLSKGALADERLAREKQAQSQSDRLAELSRNLNELQNVAGAAPAPASASAAGIPAAGIPGVVPVGLPAAGVTATDPSIQAAPAAAVPAAADGVATPGTSAPLAAADPEAASAEPAPAAPAAPGPAASEPAAPQPAAPQPAAPSLGDTLRENPALPLAGAGLLALLLGYAGYRKYQRRRAQEAATGSILRDDSLLDAGHVQPMDAAQTQLDDSAAYAHSQPETDGENDPLVEADAYLAYGRDLQAEEVLKEALRTQPERLALHQKLADIHAKRQDRKAFEAVAQTVLALTGGHGAEWLQLAEQGRALDPSNALYQAPDTAPATVDDLAVPERLEPDERALVEPASSPSPDLELGLDLPPSTSASVNSAETEAPDAPSAGTDFTPIEPIAPLAPMEPMEPMEPIEPIWKQPAAAIPQPELPALSDVPQAPADLPTAADLTLPDLQLRSEDKADAAPTRAPKTEPTLEAPDTQPPAPAAAAPAKPATPAPAAAFDFLEFDLGNLSLDLGDTPPANALSRSSQAAAEDPLATKLALAQEFSALGDNEGASTLLEEVIDESEGELKERAQRLLSEIK